MAQEYSPSLWRRAEAIFDAAVDRSPEQMAAFLDHSCGSDQKLRQAVEDLLEIDGEEASVPFPSRQASRQSPGQTLGGPPPEPLPEESFGSLELLRSIGQGGMSQVYLANRLQGGVRQRVAVKVIDAPSRPSQLRLFRREQRILALLEHPNIARFLGCGVTEQNRPYVIMEYVEGATITEYCDLRRLSISQRVRLLEKVCGAVEHAHRNLVIHCDLKPGNVLVDDDGEPKLLDFGVARLLDAATEPAHHHPTATLERFLTPAYASPEQAAGGPISVATDVYSLGVILYQLLTNHLPFSPGVGNRTAAAASGASQRPAAPPSSHGISLFPKSASDPAIEAIAEARDTTPRRLTQKLRGDLDTITLTCLERDPTQRYGSVEELRHDLARFSEGLPISARPANTLYRLGKFVGRNKAVTSLAVLAFVALLALVISTQINSLRLASERNTAQRAQRQAEQVTRFLTDALRSVDSTEKVDLGIPAGEQATVRQVLDYSARRVHREFQHQPRLQADLLRTVGAVYTSLGLTKDALPLLQQSLELHRHGLPQDDPELVSVLTALGEAQARGGDVVDAEDTFRQALEIGRRLPRATDTTVETLSGLGDLLLEKGHYEEAESLFREELEGRRLLGQAGSRKVGITRSNLGGALWLQGDLAAAEPVLRAALENLERSAGEEHPNTADALHYLAYVKAQAGDTDAAGPLFRRALEIRRKTQGNEHPDTLTSLASLGEFLYSAGDYGSAESILRQVVDLDRRIRGESHQDLVIDLNSLGISILEQTRPREAEVYVRQALELAGRIWGEDSLNTTAYRHSLAIVLEEAKQYQEAEALLRRALQQRQQQLGPDHRLTASTSVQLAAVLLEGGQEQEALVLAKKALEVYSSNQSSPTQLALARGTLGACLKRLGDQSQGIEWLTTSLTLFEKEKGVGFRTTRRLRRWLEEGMSPVR